MGRRKRASGWESKMTDRILDTEMIKLLLEAIKEKAVKIAPEYPNIANCFWREQLYAIESSYEGTCLANDDLHKLIKKLQLKLGMSNEDIITLSKEEEKCK